MKCDLQMNLRRKRNQASYQNEEHYNGLEYDEVTKGSTRKVSSNLHQENLNKTGDHGNLAKLLVDFINQINSNCRENKRISKDKERRATTIEEKVSPQPRKKPKLEQNSDSYSGPTRKQNPRDNDDKHQKSDDRKVSKELYRFKDQQALNIKGLMQDGRAAPHQQNHGKQQMFTTPPFTQDLPNIMAMMKMNSTFFTNNQFMNLANLQMGGLSNLSALPNMGGLNLNLMMQHQFGQKLPSYVCPPEAMRMSNQADSARQATQTFARNQDKSSENKLFKRAAFHVAIAYHIHLKKIQDKQKNRDALELDPTYYAKRLREKNNEPAKQEQVPRKEQPKDLGSSIQSQPSVANPPDNKSEVEALMPLAGEETLNQAQIPPVVPDGVDGIQNHGDKSEEIAPPPPSDNNN